MTKELILEILKNCEHDLINPTNEELSKYLFDRLEEVRKIKSEASSISKEYRNAKEEYDKTIKLLDEKVKLLQNKCPHYQINQNYYGDPSGGNDSYYKCSLCGKEY